jgi:RNA polymerase sigma-70 factor (ECF subfamily)
MNATAKGNAGAFERLYALHQPRVFRLAYSILLSREDARDVVQDVFVRLHQAAPTWVPRAQVSTWLYRVTLRQSLTVKRRVQAFSRTFLLAHGPPSPETTASRAQGTEVLVQSLRRLNARERALVGMYLEDGLKPSEMAPLLGMEPNATRVALHRALERVRQDLTRHGVTLENDPLEAPMEEA